MYVPLVKATEAMLFRVWLADCDMDSGLADNAVVRVGFPAVFVRVGRIVGSSTVGLVVSVGKAEGFAALVTVGTGATGGFVVNVGIAAGLVSVSVTLWTAGAAGVFVVTGTVVRVGGAAIFGLKKNDEGRLIVSEGVVKTGLDAGVDGGVTACTAGVATVGVSWCCVVFKVGFAPRLFVRVGPCCCWVVKVGFAPGMVVRVGPFCCCVVKVGFAPGMVVRVTLSCCAVVKVGLAAGAVDRATVVTATDESCRLSISQRRSAP